MVAAEPATVLAALRDALSGSGPAILPIPVATEWGVVAPPVAREGRQVPSRAIPETVPQRVALVVETSGSTSTPKRVALGADALLASAAASASAIGGHGQWLLALPAHYIAGLNVLVRSIASETSPVMLDPGSFDPLAFAAAAETMDAELRFTSVVPAQLGRLLSAEAAIPALKRFDRILVGGQSTPAPMLERARELGISLTRTYGSSETAGGCVYDGTAIGNTEVRIVGGQVELAGAVLADGYLDDEERTAATFVDDAGKRWYRTGDTGEVTDGILAVTGRLDDVIISGGVKVSVADVERVVRAMPGHSDAVVVGVPSERWGEVPVVVTTRPADLAELRATVGAALGVAAAPAMVVVTDAIPMLSSGKPDRVMIRRLAQ
jgi:O-succinylbenzoic acid--CoA ligase